MALAVAAISGLTAAYLDAKYHIRKDVNSLWDLQKAQKALVRAEKENRLALWNVFEQQVSRLPVEEECIWDRTARYSWRETHAHACRYAQFLLSLELKPHDFVAFYLTNSVEFVFSILGCWGIGAAPAMINFNLSGDGLLHCLRTCGAKVVLVDEDSDISKRIEEVRAKVEGELGMRIVNLDSCKRLEIMEIAPTRPAESLRLTQKPWDPMALFFTSGTTGFPKAVNYSIGRTWPTTVGRIQNLGITPGPNGGRWYDCMPMYHGTGANVLGMCLLRGITICIGKKFRVSTFWDDIRDSNATAFVYVGETARYLMAAPPSPRDKDHKVTMMFGNGLRPDVWQPFQRRFGIETVSEFFNSTEGVFGLLNVCRGDFLATCVGQHGAIIRLMTRNVIVPVKIDYETNEIVRDPGSGFAKRKTYNEGGEIIVKVENKELSGFTGYHRNPSATDKKFVANVFQKGDLYYRSGDALRRDPDGRWYFMDRLGDTFRWKSENVSTAEVSEQLGRYPGIVEANVYGVLVPRHDGRCGCAAVYIAPEQRHSFDLSSTGLLGFLRKSLPRYAVPVFLRIVDANELSAQMHNNKQNKVPLREEGCDLEKIRKGKAPTDKMFWLPPNGDRYTEFKQEDLDKITAGAAKL